MKSPYQETLRRVEENDDTLKSLQIGGLFAYSPGSGVFSSTDGDDMSRLGEAIGENTNLQCLKFVLGEAVASDVTNSEFYEGVKQNSSIHKLALRCQHRNVAGRMGRKILETYQQKNNHFTEVSITFALLQNGGEHLIAQTLRRSTNLKQLILYSCDLTDEQLLPMVEIMRGYSSFEYLNLNRNRIGNAGCETIATMLGDPISNLNTLHLSDNLVSVEGVTALANGLANNTKLKKLWLNGNSINQSSVEGIFNKLLCNKSSIRDTYFSNHTLQDLSLGPRQAGEHVASLLKMNKCTNKSHVAIKKILKYHPNIDMEPFFEWNMEGEGERDLKALPYVVAWFERAREAVAGDEGEESYNIDKRKLSALYQFAKAMPLLFVPAPHDKGNENK